MNTQTLFSRNNIYHALCHLVDASDEFSKWWLEEDRGINSVSFLKEFKTIKCGSARRSGHTYAALAFCQDRFKRSLFICPHRIHTINLAKTVKKLEFDSDSFVFASVDDAKKMDFNESMNFEAIVFDMSTFISNEVFDYFYKIFGNLSISFDKLPLFIIME